MANTTMPSNIIDDSVEAPNGSTSVEHNRHEEILPELIPDPAGGPSTEGHWESLLPYQQEDSIALAIALPVFEQVTSHVTDADLIAVKAPAVASKLCADRAAWMDKLVMLGRDKKRGASEFCKELPNKIQQTPRRVLIQYAALWLLVLGALVLIVVNVASIKLYILSHLHDVLVDLQEASGLPGWISRVLFFATIMTVRLFVTTLVPFLSPLFAVLIERSLPDEQKQYATLMLLFSSSLAGAVPWVLDKVVGFIVDRPLPFTRAAFTFIQYYPATCWVPALMNQAVIATESRGFDKRSSATLALVAVHTVPFGGASASLIGRLLIPSLIDNMIIQPFGMTEDCAIIILSTARTQPQLAIKSWICFLLVLIVSQGVFSYRKSPMEKKVYKCVGASVFLLVTLLCVDSLLTSSTVPIASDVHCVQVAVCMMVISLAASGFGSLVSYVLARVLSSPPYVDTSPVSAPPNMATPLLSDDILPREVHPAKLTDGLNEPATLAGKLRGIMTACRSGRAVCRSKKQASVSNGPAMPEDMACASGDDA